MSKKPNKVCYDCIHFCPCSMWNTGTLTSTDASHCKCFETLAESNAYYLGRMAGRKEMEEMTED